MKTIVKDVEEIIKDKTKIPEPWGTKVIINDDNMTYLTWNEQTKEAIFVDPMKDDWDVLIKEANNLNGYRFIAVIDTHTHADHISCAASLAERLQTPLIQHQLSPSQRIHLRVSKDTALPTTSGPLKLLVTPGHTADCITPIWGPFIYGGDMILFNDTGRDDLPGGNPATHWESLQKIKANSKLEMVMLPGHDGQGGQASSWASQLKENAGLSQDKETFIKDAGSYVGPSPKLLKESLFENFK
ncbi:MAG: MBL fold metallo-hydrolase [Oligoflexia bacterium]|nr:MBL fold metallo-hydrolase [Oligoflexia bacterium]